MRFSKRVKRTLRGVGILIILLLLITFLPIKFAARIENLDDASYIYVSEPKKHLGYPWLRYTVYPTSDSFGNINEQYCIVKGNSPLRQLSKRWFAGYIDEKWSAFLDDEGYNRFVFDGEVTDITVPDQDGGDLYGIQINVAKWDIVYPIRRHGAWGKIAPRSYLTIMDFI